ncbi:MAG: ECF transporter S component [Candidatus Howiella sp.]|jgi:ECF transporter S component (folate family)
MTRKTTQKLVMSAVFAALCCVATMIFRIPILATNGYIHFGDAFVILSGFLLGPVYGMAAAGIGSMLADILAGYAHYAIPTLLIKALAALAAALVFRALQKRKIKLVPSIVLSGLCAALIVVLGYFAVESTILGYGIAAAASIPMNALQSGAGVVISTILLPLLLRVPYFKEML